MKLKNYRLQWLNSKSEWMTQIANDNRVVFDELVANLVMTSAAEGDWMNGRSWRIAEYDLLEVELTDFDPSANDVRRLEDEGLSMT